MSDTERWYRMSDGRYAAATDEFGDSRGSGSVYVQMDGFPVLRHTPKGVWLSVYGVPRFVLRDARKRWACPTEEEARVSFLARKERQAGILRAQLAHVEDAIDLAAADHEGRLAPRRGRLPNVAV